MPSSSLTLPLAGDGKVIQQVPKIAGSRHKKRSRRPIFAHRTTKAKKKTAKASSLTALTKLQNDLVKEHDDDVDLEAVEEEDDEETPEHSSTATSSPRSVTFASEPTTVTKTAPIVTIRLPCYAWKLVETCQGEIFWQNLWWALVNGQMIVASALTITAAVLYAHYYTGYPEWNDPLAITLFGGTIILPLYVAFLVKVRKTMANAPNPFPVTMARLESEIYQFRTQVGPYQDSTTCREVFSNRAKELWSKAAEATSDQRSLELPESFWEDDDEHDTGDKTHKPSADGTRYAYNTVFSELPRPPTPAEPTETTPILSKNEKPSNESPPEELPQDPRSLLSLDDYVSVRLDKLMAKKSRHISSWQFREKVVTSIIQVVTLAATGTALVSLQWIIPILLAITAASTSLLHLANYAHAIQVETQTLQQLQDIYNQWTNDEEQQEALVLEAEAQIVSGIVQMHS